MIRNLGNCLLWLVAATIFVAIGCSDDSTTPVGDGGGGGGGAGNRIAFAKFTDLVEEIAPAAYSPPIRVPAAENDSMWNTGEHPLLGIVFSEDEPMSLYANMNNLDLFLGRISEMSGYIVDVENAGDTIVVPADQQNTTVELVNLVSASSIPADYFPVFGLSSVALAKLIKLENTDANNPYSMHCGFTISDTAQTILVYRTISDGTIDETSLFYAHAQLVDSTIDIRGVFYKDLGDSTSSRWVYNIYTVNESDFGYRMAWYADTASSSFLGSILGGGNKDDEFALRYRQFIPADAAEWDSLTVLDQIFDSNFGFVPMPEYGLGTAVDIHDIFRYDAMPPGLILSPWIE